MKSFFTQSVCVRNVPKLFFRKQASTQLIVFPACSVYRGIEAAIRICEVCFARLQAHFVLVHIQQTRLCLVLLLDVGYRFITPVYKMEDSYRW